MRFDMTVTSAVAAQTASTQARTQFAVSARLLEIAAETNASREVVLQAQRSASAAVDAINAAVEHLAGGLDEYA
jgi:hypothetical protein